MYMKRKVRTQLYLDASQKEFLDERARETGTSLGQLVREAVEIYMREAPERPLAADDPLWFFVGAGERRSTDVAARHDDYLYGDDPA